MDSNKNIMNKRGVAPLMIAIAIIYFLFGMVLYQFLKADIDTSRTAMSCTSPSSWGDMFNCLIVGSVVPIVVIGILATAFAYATTEAKR